MPFTSNDPEAAAAAGKRSGEVRRIKRNPNEKAKAALLRGVSSAAETIVAVCAGEAGFEEAKPELRFKAAELILAYVIGKPAGVLDEPEKAENDDATNPFASLFGSTSGPVEDVSVN